MPVRVEGGVALRKALRKFEPDLAKETTKEIATFLKPVVRNARGFMPSNDEIPSGWLKRPEAKGKWAARYYDAAETRRGITYKSSPSRKNNRGWVALASVMSKNPAAMIYEWAGRKSGITGNFTPHLGGEIKGTKEAMKGRALFRAYYEDRGKARDGVLHAVEKAAAKFKARTKI